jgi:hypothetical protein
MQEEDGTEIAVLYRQFDGYPSEHGKKLADFLKGRRITNGISGDTPAGTTFNGAACMAASIISHFKANDLGGFYLHPAGTRDLDEDYIYTVGVDGEKITLGISGHGDLLFAGLVDDYEPPKD